MISCTHDFMDEFTAENKKQTELAHKITECKKPYEDSTL